MRQAALLSLVVLGVCLTLSGCTTQEVGAGASLPARDFEPQRPEFEALAASFRAGGSEYLGTAQVGQLEEKLLQPLTPDVRLATLGELAFHKARLGQNDEAVEVINSATALAEGSEISTKARIEHYFLRGVVYMRQAETQNCILRHNRDCCIFPLARGGVHQVAAPVREARAAFEKLLELNPQELRAAWLLNVIAMAAGDYPQGVLRRYQIPPAALASDFDLAPFDDVAPEVGLDVLNNAGGAVVDDIDGDGLLDIVTSSSDPGAPLNYQRNLGDGRFEDLSHASRLDDQLGGLNMISGDYDGDGDLDLLVLRGGWLFDGGQIRKSLLRNDGGRTFTDVTRESGLIAHTFPTQTAAWGDYDNDGDLDLFSGSESPQEDPGRYPSQLYVNNGNGTFTDVATEAGVALSGYVKGVAMGDYDNDGDQDLYISAIGPNHLYRNDGGMRFVDVAPELGMIEPTGRSFATWFFDYNNDGWLDIWVGGYDAKVGDVYLDLLGKEQDSSPPRLYRNNGDGSFTNVAAELDLHHAWLPMGANFGDIDNDGWLDIYLGTGNPLFVTLMPNVMLRNDAGRRFQDVTTASRTGHLQKGHGVAFADLDDDGDQDLFHQLGGFYPGDRFKNALFANPGHGGHWLTVELRGGAKNSRAFGARLRAVVRTPAGERSVHRAVGSVSSFGGSPFRQEIGLGDAEDVVRLEIVWPAPSGKRQVIERPPLDAIIRVVEGRDGYERADRPRFDLLAARSETE